MTQKNWLQYVLVYVDVFGRIIGMSQYMYICKLYMYIHVLYMCQQYVIVFEGKIRMRDQLGRLLSRDFTTFILSFYCISDSSSQFFHFISISLKCDTRWKCSICQYTGIYVDAFEGISGMRDQLGRLLPRDFTTFSLSFYCISDVSSKFFHFISIYLKCDTQKDECSIYIRMYLGW